MSMFSIFDISASALTAQSQRMNVSASNLANADSVAGPDGQPYRAKQVIFESRLQDAQTRVTVSLVCKYAKWWKTNRHCGWSIAQGIR